MSVGQSPESGKASPFEELVELYEAHGTGKYMIQEDITQRSHALQAAFFARCCGAPEEVIVSLLFHDVGQLCDSALLGHAHKLHASHAEMGEEWLLSRGFPADVAAFVGLHTAAKVVLCEEQETYYDTLSRASQISYHIQKKKYEMHGSSVLERLRTSPLRARFLACRMCDDLAKVANFTTREDAAAVNGCPLDAGSDKGPHSCRDTAGGCARKVATSLELPPFSEYRCMVERVLCDKGRPAVCEDWQQRAASLHAEMVRDRVQFEQDVCSGKVCVACAASPVVR
eukprot:TRINITY_DN2270_c0_g1_i1.p1 TRINITY_DN2270_c0_g1~~TRINITY_DN2270_c0_g1_i1.p1  ORF type:complete len:285 (+),score=94.61 TRINITY_DN2270_c0_g1_i1:325-1179(+)